MVWVWELVRWEEWRVKSEEERKEEEKGREKKKKGDQRPQKVNAQNGTELLSETDE